MPIGIYEVNSTRLNSWKKKLTDAKSTAYFLVGIGHGDQTGKLTLLMLEDGDIEVVKAMMRKMIEELK
ncbi:MAG: hypothetical protein ACKVPJ_13580 [Chitinophagales bacterium]